MEPYDRMMNQVELPFHSILFPSQSGGEKGGKFHYHYDPIKKLGSVAGEGKVFPLTLTSF